MKFTKKEISLAWLEQKYTQEGLTLREIASISDYSVSSIANYLDKYGIPKRPNWSMKCGAKHHLWKGGSYDYYHYTARKVWEEYWREKIPEWGLIHHLDGDMTNNHISNLLMTNKSIHTKKHITDETRKKMSLSRIGNKNHRWKDGRSYKIYPHRLKALAVLEEGK